MRRDSEARYAQGITRARVFDRVVDRFANNSRHNEVLLQCTGHSRIRRTTFAFFEQHNVSQTARFETRGGTRAPPFDRVADRFAIAVVTPMLVIVSSTLDHDTQRVCRPGVSV